MQQSTFVAASSLISFLACLWLKTRTGKDKCRPAVLQIALYSLKKPNSPLLFYFFNFFIPEFLSHTHSTEMRVETHRHISETGFSSTKV